MNKFQEFWNIPTEEKFQFVWFNALVVAFVTLMLVGLPLVLNSLC